MTSGENPIFTYRTQTGQHDSSHAGIYKYFYFTGHTLMYSLQQQYNLVPGNYAKEIASVSAYVKKGVTTLLQGGRRSLHKRPSSSLSKP